MFIYYAKFSFYNTLYFATLHPHKFNKLNKFNNIARIFVLKATSKINFLGFCYLDCGLMLVTKYAPGLAGCRIVVGPWQLHSLVYNSNSGEYQFISVSFVGLSSKLLQPSPDKLKMSPLKCLLTFAASAATPAIKSVHTTNIPSSLILPLAPLITITNSLTPKNPSLHRLFHNSWMSFRSQDIHSKNSCNIAWRVAAHMLIIRRLDLHWPMFPLLLLHLLSSSYSSSSCPPLRSYLSLPTPLKHRHTFKHLEVMLNT